MFGEITEKFGNSQQEAPKHGFLLVPEELTGEEWIARHSPKDGPLPEGKEFLEE